MSADIPSASALRAMAIVRWCLLLAVASVAAWTWWSVGAAPNESGGEPLYYCPMHPQITAHDPGTCPICFMTLEPIADRALDEAEAETADSEADPLAGTAPVMLTLARRQRSGITVTTVARAEGEATVRWPAVVRALRGASAEVRVRTEAFVERVAVSEPGTRVRRGQILAWVYAPEILRAEEELLAAHRWRESSSETGAPHVGGAAIRRLELLGVARSEIDTVLASGTTRRRIPVRAPISGVVTSFAATRGSQAVAGTVLYEITDYDQVHVVATVLDASDVALAREGSPVLQRPWGAAVPITFAFVEPTLDPSSRGAEVVFLADNADSTLRPGAIGDVVVARLGESQLVIPRDAVIDRGHVRYVFVEVEPGLFEPRAITVGALLGEHVAVLDGLEEGDRIVARGGFLLDSESRLGGALGPSGPAESAAPSPPPAHDHGETPP